MISLKTTSFTVRGKRVKAPSFEWIRVEDAHEPIVKANTMFRQMEFRLSGKTGKKNLLLRSLWKKNTER